MAIATAHAVTANPRLGAWRSGDHPGRRQFATLFSQQPLQLESGVAFGPITLAYETWGQLNADSCCMVSAAIAMRLERRGWGTPPPAGGTA